MYLFFDTETTGKPRNYKAPLSDLGNWPRVVQIGWMQFDKEGQSLFGVERIIKPEGFVIPADASRIHGITTARALAEGSRLADVLAEFIVAASAAKVVVAHNLAFDENIVGAEFLRTGTANVLSKKKRICTMQVSTEFCRLPGSYGYKWPTLTELYGKLFKKRLEEAHSALADVKACAECFFELKRLGVL